MTKMEMINFLNRLLNASTSGEGLCVSAKAIAILKEIRDDLQVQPVPMENIELTKSADGHWLSVQTNDNNDGKLRRHGAIHLESMKHGPAVNNAFLQWAREEMRRQKE